MYSKYGPLEPKKVRLYLSVAFATALIATVVGPFGTYADMQMETRASFWFSSILLGWFTLIVITFVIRGFLSAHIKQGWMHFVVSVLFTCLPITFLVRTLNHAILGPGIFDDPIWLTFIHVSILTVIFGFFQWKYIEVWPFRNFNRQHLKGEIPSTSPELIRLKKMPTGLSGQIICLQSEDHYVRVYTEHGNGLVRMRFVDAIDELKSVDGLRVHRSWWVLRSAIKGKSKNNDKSFLLLRNELLVPVSRRNKKTVQQLDLHR